MNFMAAGYVTKFIVPISLDLEERTSWMLTQNTTIHFFALFASVEVTVEPKCVTDSCFW